MCRDSWWQGIPLNVFGVYSCSKCFHQVFLGRKPLVFDVTDPLNLHLRSNLSKTFHLGDVMDGLSWRRSEGIQNICDEWLTSQECKHWLECCESAVECCLNAQESQNDLGFNWIDNTFLIDLCW